MGEERMGEGGGWLDRDRGFGGGKRGKGKCFGRPDRFGHYRHPYFTSLKVRARQRAGGAE